MRPSFPLQNTGKAIALSGASLLGLLAVETSPSPSNSVQHDSKELGVKKLISAVGALAALMLVPVVAQATTSTTIHLNGGAIDVGPAGCIAGDLVITGNGVLHQTR